MTGPYVLVGHSSGGPYVRVFAARYPDRGRGHGPAGRPAGRRIHRASRVPGASTTRTGSSPPCPRRRPASGSSDRSSGCRPTSRPPAAARGARNEVCALPTALDAGLGADRRSAIVRSSSSPPDPEPQSRLVGGAGRHGRTVDHERSSGHRHRNPQLADLGRGRRRIRAGDPRRPAIGPSRDAGPMNAASGRLLTRSGRRPAMAVDRRSLERAIATLVIGGYMAARVRAPPQRRGIPARRDPDHGRVPGTGRPSTAPGALAPRARQP